MNKRCDGLAPVINSDSEILILGTFPGKDSLSQNEYYANQDNIFWDIIYRVFNPPVNSEFCLALSYEEKTKLLLDNKIALWDVLGSCLREGNRDSKITGERLNDFSSFLSAYPNIRTIVEILMNVTTPIRRKLTIHSGRN